MSVPRCRWRRVQGLTLLDMRMELPTRSGPKSGLDTHLFRQAEWQLASVRDVLSIRFAIPLAKHRLGRLQKYFLRKETQRTQ